MLSKKAQYAFHALSFLVEYADQGPVLISKIAEEKGISQKFLEAILLELKRGGILGSKKGKGGGYYLIKAPNEVPLARAVSVPPGLFLAQASRSAIRLKLACLSCLFCSLASWPAGS